MKHKLKYIIIALLWMGILPFHANAAEELIPVGQVIGLELRDGNVIVAAMDEVLGSRCKEAGVQVGDCIEKIDKVVIHNSQDVHKALSQSDGTVTLEIRRNGKTETLKVSPQITADGPKLGLYLRQGVTGIGTVTWYDPESGEFGTLGHGVNNAQGKLLTMLEGNAYEARVLTVKKGKTGTPGQLMGAIEKLEPIGELEKNTDQGVFGSSKTGWQGEEMEILEKSKVHTGAATIRSTVSGVEVREYSVEILKIYPKAKQSGRNLLIRITDPELLAQTGGIVQGMSGSPIIQDGKLVGAVTHVLVNDPTTGYGIFIENMLDAAA